MSLRQETVSGLIWSFIDSSAKLGITFVSEVILARLLSPREFGLVGMTTIFIAVSQSVIDSGFRQALIRKKECTQADFSTVFYFNLFIGVILYLVLYFSAGLIGEFFHEPQLRGIIQLIGLGLIINAFSLVQSTRLIKAINFRLQTKISIISSVIAGAIGIYMAFKGFGVWSLVASTLSGAMISLLLLWVLNDWRPSLLFSWGSFREMFAFGSKLLVSGLLNTLYTNIYNLIIGRYFSAAALGYYNRANDFSKLPSQYITGVIQRVSYPILAKLQDDTQRLKSAYQKLIKSTMLITFVLMLGLAATAEPVVITLVGEQWRPAISYLQLLCFVGMFYPLHAMNLNMLQVLGRSDLFLRLEVIKKVLSIPVIVIGVLLGIKALLIAMFFNTLVAYLLNSYWSGKFIGYSTRQQIRDLLPSFGLAAFTGVVVYLFGRVLDVPDALKLILQLILGATLSLGCAHVLQLDNYLYIKDIVVEKVRESFTARRSGP